MKKVKIGSRLTKQSRLSFCLLSKLLKRPLLFLLLGQGVEQVQVDACLCHCERNMLDGCQYEQMWGFRVAYTMVQSLSRVLGGLCVVQKLQRSIVEVFPS